jgi:hypothetical protein
VTERIYSVDSVAQSIDMIHPVWQSTVAPQHNDGYMKIVLDSVVSFQRRACFFFVLAQRADPPVKAPYRALGTLG